MSDADIAAIAAIAPGEMRILDSAHPAPDHMGHAH